MTIKETKDIRCANRLKILHTIIENKYISRADTALLTGLNKATVSTIVKELIDLNLIEESTFGESTGGRKPIILTLKKDVGYSIALDINISKITVLLMDLNFNILQERIFPVYSTDVYKTFSHLCEGIHELIDMSPRCAYNLIGISVAVRGIVDLEGMIRFIPSLNWHNINLKNILESEFSVPVFLDNDGNLAAIAESKSDSSSREMVVITIDDVISSGIISNGQLVRGFLGFANSIGHHIIDMNYPEECQCGKYGCWEQFCSYTSFLKHIAPTIPADTIETFIELAKQNYPGTKEALDYFVKHLAVGISNIIFILNCENIILNSTIFEEFPHLINEIHQRLSLPITNFQKLSTSKLGKLAPLLGAASICTEAFFTKTLDS